MLLLAIVLALALSFAGCGNGDQEDVGLNNEYEVEEVPVMEKDEPDNKHEGVDPDASDLWALAADKSLGDNLPKKDDVPYPAYPGAKMKSQQEGFSYLLWQGEAGEEERAYTLLIPAILIREPHGMELDYMDDWLPGTKTEITVVYSAD